MSKQGSTQFNCFSPPVMVATLIVESVFAVYTLWRYTMTTATRLVVTSLIALATFQFAEYHVCTGFGINAGDWSRLGFAAITTLPPLGLHLLHVLGHKPKRRLVVLSYILMAGFIFYFLTYAAAFAGYQCTGNYVIFQIGVRPAMVYALYYYGLLLAGVYLGLQWSKDFMSEGRAALTKLQTTRALIIGYLVFLVPTALANSVAPAARRGIPSIMCGFAVLFALILSLYVMPKIGKKRVARLPGAVS
jgi:hypothetical protein